MQLKNFHNREKKSIKKWFIMFTKNPMENVKILFAIHKLTMGDMTIQVILIGQEQTKPMILEICGIFLIQKNLNVKLQKY